MNQMPRSAAFWVVVTLLLMVLWTTTRHGDEYVKEVPYSRFVQDVEAGKVKGVSIQQNEITFVYKDTDKGRTISPPEDQTLLPLLRDKGVEVVAKSAPEVPWYILIGSQLVPVVILVAAWIFVMRQMQGNAGKGMNFGKSKAKLLNESQNVVTFNDVAGIDEARAELEEIIDFLKDPKKFTRLGGRIPKGVLLIGSPGTGKTLLAKAIAGEAGVPFFSISGSDFVEMFVGVGASRVRDLFLQGKKHAPCIIFIDEIDAVGRHRGAGLGGGHDEREQTLNQLLVEMDGFESNEGVILIAATNRPDVLDPALLRPGRFDRRVVVPRPDIKGRLGILKVHTKKVPLDPKVDLEVVARGTPGFAGADLEILVNEAALRAARQNRDKVMAADFEFAKDKVTMGAERRSMLLTEKEKLTTAYHEAGHALVAKLLPNADPVHKLTIVPRGMALGLMQQLPEADRHTYSKNYWIDQLAVCYGGRAAEELVFNDMNTGASSDIETASNIARRMVTEWGMSQKLGHVRYSSKQEHMFLGREIGSPREHSEHIQEEIDTEVQSIIDVSYETAKRLIKDNLETLHCLARAVMQRETLDAPMIDILMRGGELPPAPPVDTGVPPPSTEKNDKGQPAVPSGSTIAVTA